MPDVLIVDDDADAAGALGELLGVEGHQVRVAFSGEQGLAFLNQRPPDLLLLDVEMPILDGPGVAARILMHDAGLERVPVILVSGVRDLPQIAERLGIPYYLSKPFPYEL
jgi:CheY-like chemotaxis protein